MARNLKARILILGLTLALSFGLISLSASAQQFITVSYPGSTNTYPSVINNRGEIVGYYSDSGGVYHGFTLLNGQYATLNVPGAADSFASGINDLGEIVGAYIQTAGGNQHGFLFDGSTYSTIDFPGSAYTGLASINNLGQIVGIYANAGSSVVHGFSFKAGVFTTIDFPGSNPNNYPNQVNNFGVIAGGYIDASSVYHGFVYDAGTFTSINFPGATNTTVTGINDGGELAGAYCDAVTCPFFTPGPQKYFTETNGQFKTVDVPTAGEVANLNLELNNAGQLVAAYQDSAGNAHGAVSAIGPFAYVGNYIAASCCTLTVLDTSTNLVLTTIPIGGLGYPLGISPDQTHLYVPISIGNAVGNAVGVIDTTTNSVVGTIAGVGPGANAVTIAPNGKFGYTANAIFDGAGSDSVSIFSTTSDSVVATVPLTFPAGYVTVTPDGSLLYASGTGSTIAVINTSTNTVESTFSIPVPAGGGNSGPFFNSSGSLGYAAQNVASVTPGTVTVISIPSNETVATIQVGTQPQDIAITPDGAYAYVSNVGSNNVSVIDTSSNTVISTVPVGNQPNSIAITPDGALAYVANLADSTLSVIQTSTNSVVATIPITTPFGSLIPSAPPTSQSITQPLSPTAPNQFNYGPHNFTVQYPAGTEFSGVNMTVVAAQATQASIQQRLAGTQFANAVCIVYSGAGGNCVDYQVTCSNTGGGEITCPSESSPTITVKSSFDTLQPITNPGFLTTPIGTNDWTNIFESFFLQRIDPTVKGRTSGFSEFLAVDLGATNGQGAGTFQFLAPLQSNDRRTFPVGASIPVKFHLASVPNPAVPISDATAGITVVMISDATGDPTTNLVLEKPAAFTYGGENYAYSLNTSGYAAGVYNVTVYGDAFVAQQVEFTLTAPAPPRISTTLQSLSQNETSNQYVVVFKISNTGGTVAKSLVITASKLNSASTATSLPITVGNVNAGSSVNVTLSFPATAGAPNSSGEITISESYAGGTSGGGFRVTLP
jgi:YVTN family beta-propeller protein/probable HAF family extracellular repeat protein